MPLVTDYCETKVVTASPKEGLWEVAQRMRDRHVGCVVVLPERAAVRQAPIGILTDRDIVVGVLAQTDRQLHLVLVGDVMSTEPITAQEDDDLSETLTRMRAAGVRRVPVVRRDETLVGVLSFDDLVAYIEDELSELAALVTREREVEVARRGRIPS
jgi:CBS domain-containing protein